MNRRSIALFLSTVALAGATTACSPRDEAGEKGGDHQEQPQLKPPAPAAPAHSGGAKGDEGGEGGEG